MKSTPAITDNKGKLFVMLFAGFEPFIGISLKPGTRIRSCGRLQHSVPG